MTVTGHRRFNDLAGAFDSLAELLAGGVGRRRVRTAHRPSRGDCANPRGWSGSRTDAHGVPRSSSSPTFGVVSRKRRRPASPCRRASGARRAVPPTGARRAWGVAVQRKGSNRVAGRSYPSAYAIASTASSCSSRVRCSLTPQPPCRASQPPPAHTHACAPHAWRFASGR